LKEHTGKSDGQNLFFELGGGCLPPSFLQAIGVPMENLLSPKDISKMLKCSLPWVYKAAENGILPSIRIPCPGNGKRLKHMVRFEVDAVRLFLERHRQKGEKLKG
jgi:hypothetical protein